MSLSFGSQDKTTNTNTNTNTAQDPWAPAIPGLMSLINKAGGLNTSVTPGQNDAFSQLLANVSKGDPGAGQIADNAKTQLATPNQTGLVNDALKNESDYLTPFARGDYTDVLKNPQVQGLLDTIRNDVGNSVNQQFAGAGRSLSGMNQQALARGISQGEAAPLLNEYNTQTGNQLTAAGLLGSATNSAATTNAGLTAAQIAAQNAGINTDQAGLAAGNYAPSQALTIGQQQTQLPFQNLGLLASLLAPVAGLGGTQNQNSNSTAVTHGTSFGASGNILSDERAKEDIREVGKMADGTPIHSYRYKGDPTTRVGPMAQEVEERNPDAVSNDGPGGLKTVDMKAATDKAAAILRQRVAARRKAA